MKCQFGISSGWGGRRYPPYAFTEQGVAMLSSVLHSKRAVRIVTPSCWPEGIPLSRKAQQLNGDEHEPHNERHKRAQREYEADRTHTRRHKHHGSLEYAGDGGRAGEDRAAQHSDGHEDAGDTHEQVMDDEP